MSEDGIDEEGSCAESWATPSISELSHFKKERIADKVNKANNPNHLELAEDFLEMERLACLSTESNGAISISDGLTDKRTENVDHNALADVAKGGDLRSKQQTGFYPSANQVSLESSTMELESDTDQVSLAKLRSRISMIFAFQAKDANVEKTLEDIKHVMLDLQDAQLQHSVSCIVEESHSADATCNRKACPLDIGESMESGSSLTKDSKPVKILSIS